MVRSAGDVNGDGFDDVVVDAARYGDGVRADGSVRVFLGSAAGLATEPAWAAVGLEEGTTIGGVGAAAGDVNGDGYGDVIVGSFAYVEGADQSSEAFLYLGSADGLEAAPAWSAPTIGVASAFAMMVRTAGDVDGDGYDDVLVGASSLDSPEYSEGAVFLYHGGPTGLAPDYAWSADSDQGASYFGTGLGAAGDVNGDGYGDVVVGARTFDAPEQNEGRVYLYLGSAGGLSTTAAWTAEPDVWDAQMGQSVSSAGDVNGDGYDDVVVGAPGFDNKAEQSAGKA